jgi:hypothetical protein
MRSIAALGLNHHWVLLLHVLGTGPVLVERSEMLQKTNWSVLVRVRYA